MNLIPIHKGVIGTNSICCMITDMNVIDWTQNVLFIHLANNYLKYIYLE